MIKAISPTVLNTAAEVALEIGVDPALAQAIVLVESAGQPSACRYEPKWQTFFRIEAFAKELRQSFDTEKVQQATSWGAMQVMGTVARERGFQSYLPRLTNERIGIYFGCKHLFWLMKRYGGHELEIISAYNAGSPRRNTDGTFLNQFYVTKVQTELLRIRASVS